MMNTQSRRLVILVVIIALIAGMFGVLTLVSRSNKTKVTIKTLPADSQIFIDGKPSKAGTVYLDNATHLFTAKREGFKEDSQTRQLNGEAQTVNLLPSPVSDSAYDYLRDNPDIQREREALGAERVEQLGQSAQAITPLIRLLPRVDYEGPYRIDYGPSTSRANGTFIQITISSPKGRANALQWIREQGYDPTDLEIRYKDFYNPLVPGGSS